MGLAYANLDAATRQCMIQEIELDIKNGTLYKSSWLTERGKTDYASLLKEAAEKGSDDTLAAALAQNNRIKLKATRKKPRSEELVEYDVPRTAPGTMAGEFNIFYVRGLCVRAIQEGIPKLEIYRAAERDEPRPESLRMVGNLIDPKATLDDLRTSQGKAPKLGFPPGPNTGLSAKIP